MRPALYLVAILTCLASAGVGAQPYRHAAGVRAGYSSGITYKHFFLFKMAALEADALYNPHGFSVTALYEHHIELFRSERILAFLGGGAFGGDWEEEPSVGLAAVAGMEIVIRDLPLNVGLDWKPMVNLYRTYEFEFFDVGLSIRYRFAL